jgi:hypothetical protein
MVDEYWGWISKVDYRLPAYLNVPADRKARNMRSPAQCDRRLHAIIIYFHLDTIFG